MQENYIKNLKALKKILSTYDKKLLMQKLINIHKVIKSS